MEEKSREFAKRGYVLDFNTAQILSSDEKRLFIQYHDLKKRMAVDMDSGELHIISSWDDEDD